MCCTLRPQISKFMIVLHLKKQKKFVPITNGPNMFHSRKPFD